MFTDVGVVVLDEEVDGSVVEGLDGVGDCLRCDDVVVPDGLGDNVVCCSVVAAGHGEVVEVPEIAELGERSGVTKMKLSSEAALEDD